MKIVIDRSKWRTGGESGSKTGKGSTRLLNREGYMCCLGFICHQEGCGKEDILDKEDPSFLSNAPEKLTLDLIDQAIYINDTDSKPLDAKEKELVELFNHIYDIEFFGDPS